MPTCAHCGATMKPGWSFCGNCRAPAPPLSSPPSAAAPAVAPALVPPLAPQAPPPPLPVATWLPPPGPSDNLAARHRRLHACAKLFKVLFWASLVGGVLFTIAWLASAQEMLPRGVVSGFVPIAAIFILAAGFCSALPWWWASEITQLAIRVEECVTKEQP